MKTTICGWCLNPIDKCTCNSAARGLGNVELVILLFLATALFTALFVWP